MNSIWKLPVMLLATGSSVLFFLCLSSGQKRFGALVEGLPAKDPLREFYVVGFRLTELLRLNFNSRRAKQRIRQCEVIYGKKYAEYYYRLLVAKQLTVPLLVLILGLCLTAVMDTPLLAGLALVSALGVAYYYETTITDITKARAESIRRDFPTVVSTLALLVNAGLIVREAWDKTGRKGEGVIHQEMRQAVLNMENGMSEVDAYLEFARRCDSEPVTKFAAALVQNLTKGNSELVEFLRQYASESWEERKQAVRVLGEEASTKLMIPITIMMLGLLIMLCVPIMSGMTMG